MAKITITPAIIPEPIPVIPAKFTFEMNAKETALLYVLMQKIGGAPDTTLRGIAQDIGRALDKIPGLSSLSWKLAGEGGINSLVEAQKHSGSGIYFATDSHRNPIFQRIVDLLEAAE